MCLLGPGRAIVDPLHTGWTWTLVSQGGAHALPHWPAVPQAPERGQRIERTNKTTHGNFDPDPCLPRRLCNNLYLLAQLEQCLQSAA